MANRCIHTFTFFTLLAASGCLEREFGFGENPATMLARGHAAIQRANLSGVKAVLGGKALCEWGSSEGIAKLKPLMPERIEQTTVEVSQTDDQVLARPRYIGYWSYHRTDFEVRVLDKRTRNLLFTVQSECDFGEEGVRSGTRRPWREYPVRRCRITGLEAPNVEPPSADCAFFN
jgi:hypothetical protein